MRDLRLLHLCHLHLGCARRTARPDYHRRRAFRDAHSALHRSHRPILRTGKDLDFDGTYPPGTNDTVAYDELYKT